MENNWIYIELANSNIEGSVINSFDCGNINITEYLHKMAKKEAIEGKGVTYVLVREDEYKNGNIKRIYAYATIKAHSLNYYELASKYPWTKEADENGKVLSSLPSVEIKMFAIDKGFRGSVPRSNFPFSDIFFKLFLMDLYLMSMNIIGFNIIFLRSNTEGEKLYRRCMFLDCDNYLKTYDEAAEGCKQLYLAISDLEYIIF